MRIKSKMCMIGHRAAGRSRTASLGINQHMHLEDIAKEAGVLKDWEETGTAKAAPRPGGGQT